MFKFLKPKVTGTEHRSFCIKIGGGCFYSFLQKQPLSCDAVSKKSPVRSKASKAFCFCLGYPNGRVLLSLLQRPLLFCYFKKNLFFLLLCRYRVCYFYVTRHFMMKSAHMILQSQQLHQLIIFLIDQILCCFLEELLTCHAVTCFICSYDDPVVSCENVRLDLQRSRPVIHDAAIVFDMAECRQQRGCQIDIDLIVVRCICIEQGPDVILSLDEQPAAIQFKGLLHQNDLVIPVRQILCAVIKGSPSHLHLLSHSLHRRNPSSCFCYRSPSRHDRMTGHCAAGRLPAAYYSWLYRLPHPVSYRRSVSADPPDVYAEPCKA